MEQLSQLRMQDHELTMRQMVEEIHRGLLNIGQAAAKFEVTRQTVKHWVDKVEQETASAEKKASKAAAQRRSRRKKTPPPSADQATARTMELQTKIVALERELEASIFKTLYYSTLIRVAEQELGIDIEKKSVTRQSGSCS
jgi:transposase-like protein